MRMATISRFPIISHLRAEPNQYIIYYSGGRIRRRGPGLAFWFRPLAAAIVELPVQDCATTFVLKERTADFQEVLVQCTLVYRISDPERASQRINFTVSLLSGLWLEKPLERLETFWAQRARGPGRSYINSVPLTEAVQRGPASVRERMLSALRDDPEAAAMGVSLVDVQVDQVAPTAELQKALETPTREALHQRADTAVFERRALAVEKERAIKENELATEIELARRQEQLIRQQGANQLLEVQRSAEAERVRAQAELERQQLSAEGYANATRTRASGDAEAQRAIAEVQAEVELKRVETWAKASPELLLGLALQELAGNLKQVNHLNITPDLVGDGLQRLLRRQGER
jgi:regulator of protease activity HflC (stomatin/prohibitin superfamily)